MIELPSAVSSRPESLSHGRFQLITGLWVGASLLHIVADPVTTYTAVVLVEAGIEANPVLRGWVQQGPVAFVLVHIPLIVASIVGWAALLLLLDRSTPRETTQVFYISIVALSGIILWGVFLLVNNLRVILAGL